MRLTLFGFSPDEVKSFAGLPEDFQFTAPNFNYKCSLKAAIAIAPVIKKLLYENACIDSFEITVSIGRPFLNLFFNTLKGIQIVISRSNSNQYLPLAELLENEDLKQSIRIINDKKISQKEVVSYIINHSKKGLTILHDLRYVAANFRKFYHDPSLSMFSPEILRLISECNKISNENKRLVNMYYKRVTNQTNTLENYFILSSSVTRNTFIELQYDGENDLLGIIANLTALAGKNICIARTIFLEAPIPVKNIQNIVDLKNQTATLRIPCNSLNYIHYDFRERKISITSITIQVGDNDFEAPNHWALLGSNNLDEWEVIMENRGDKDLRLAFAIKNYSCYESPYYRYIRFVQRTNFSKKKNKNVINISSIEFFGKLVVI